MAEDTATTDALGSTDARPREDILLVIPCFQAVYPKPFGNFLGMAFNAAQAVHDRYRIDVLVPERKLLHSAMNEVGELVLQHGHAAIILCDDDCTPPYDAIPRLLRYHEQGYDFVAGAGFMRGGRHTTTLGKYYPEGAQAVLQPDGTWGLTGFEWQDDLSKLPQGLVEVDFCGFPIALISRRIFERVPYPWFGTHIDEGECTHDVYFGKRTRAAGFKLYADTTIQCGHLGEAPLITFENRQIVRDFLAIRMASARPTRPGAPVPAESDHSPLAGAGVVVETP